MNFEDKLRFEFEEEDNEKLNGKFVWINTNYLEAYKSDTTDSFKIDFETFYPKLIESLYNSQDPIIKEIIKNKCTGLQDAIKLKEQGRIKDPWHFNFVASNGEQRIIQLLTKLSSKREEQDILLLSIFLFSVKIIINVEKEFNQTILYGKDVSIPLIIDYAKRFPMMANYQVVIIKEAQDMEKNQKIEDLNAYLEKAQESTILVLCYKYKKVDGRSSFKKTLEKKGVYFESKKLYDNEIPKWIIDYLKNKEYGISPDACSLLSDYLGNDLQKIVNEISKLIINVPLRSTITADIIEENIGISKDFNIFELQKAIGNKDIVKANQIINYFAANPKENPNIKNLPILSSLFSKLLIYHELPDKSNRSVAAALGINPFFVNDYHTASRNYSREKLMQIYSLLREYDVKSKGVDNNSASDGELLKELIFKIMH